MGRRRQINDFIPNMPSRLPESESDLDVTQGRESGAGASRVAGIKSRVSGQSWPFHEASL